ncbi:class I SAM-dependent methyltransferase [Euzebya tangerina]|uniref:class I SAM-dependent methyltransferase n=1 Tax=Euzebya tangerina TaxID=591198 RepID=UPI0013C2FDC9|nr:class I SAM-dependent methyltransferase [Euzebya tangerina]
MTSAPHLPITGERTVPGVEAENYWFQRHVIAYEWAATRCRDRVVVDAGCGEGYGLPILARRAASVTGIELVAPVVDHVRRAYPDQPVLEADICDTGLPSSSVDIVVNLQVIEHLPDVPRFLGEVSRILRPGGELIVATPNRLTFSPHDDHGADPTNVFHVEEFTAAELIDRLRTLGAFTVEQVLGVHHGARLRALDRLLRIAGDDRTPDTASPFVDRLVTPVEQWPAWLHATVRRITPRSFVLRRTHIDASLDLLVVARNG